MFSQQSYSILKLSAYPNNSDKVISICDIILSQDRRKQESGLKSTANH